jgi:hypothetical protein
MVKAVFSPEIHVQNLKRYLKIQFVFYKHILLLLQIEKVFFCMIHGIRDREKGIKIQTKVPILGFYRTTESADRAHQKKDYFYHKNNSRERRLKSRKKEVTIPFAYQKNFFQIPYGALLNMLQEKKTTENMVKKEETGLAQDMPFVQKIPKSLQR